MDLGIASFCMEKIFSKTLPLLYEYNDKALQKEMATHSSRLAWEFTWTEEPSGLLSMQLQKSWNNLTTKQQSMIKPIRNGSYFLFVGN